MTQDDLRKTGKAPQGQTEALDMDAAIQEMQRRGELYGSYHRKFLDWLGEETLITLKAWILKRCDEAQAEQAAQLLETTVLVHVCAERLFQGQPLQWWDLNLLAENVPMATQMLESLGVETPTTLE